METKICLICEKEKPFDEFAKSTQRSQGRGSYCKPCDNARKKKWKEENAEHARKYMQAYQKKWRQDNPDKVREYDRRGSLKKNYGITDVEYDLLLEKQGGCCAICRKAKGDSRGYLMPVDHNHETNEIRGILCPQCNFGLGQFNDSVSLLVSAINYLEGKS
jgi:hypothetical protein